MNGFAACPCTDKRESFIKAEKAPIDCSGAEAVSHCRCTLQPAGSVLKIGATPSPARQGSRQQGNLMQGMFSGGGKTAQCCPLQPADQYRNIYAYTHRLPTLSMQFLAHLPTQRVFKVSLHNSLAFIYKLCRAGRWPSRATGFKLLPGVPIYEASKYTGNLAGGAAEEGLAFLL